MKPSAVITLCGVQFSPVTVEELHDYLAHTVRSKGHELVLHVNAHAINLAQKDGEFRRVLNGASLVFCDGFGVRVGARMLGYRVPPRITYADWIWKLAVFAEREQFSLFLLGGRPGVPEAAAEKLQAIAPKLSIAGTHHGYFDKAAGAQNDAVVAAINRAKPDILLVCFGMPLQERWLDENWGRLDARVALSGGAALDYASGQLRRGPAVLTNFGFEWLARLLIEPGRLWRRYVLGNPLFLARVLRQRFGRRP